MKTNRQTLPCSVCGQPVQAAGEAVRVTCARCLTRRGSAARPDAETPSPPRALAAVVKRRCANAASGNDLCILDGHPCPVTVGGRCAWFEKAIVPALYGGDLATAQEHYVPAEGVEALRAKRKARQCPDCGAVLPPRRRYCATCAERRRRAAKRASTRKARSL